MTIRVLIADDQPLMRTGFRMILDAEPDLEVVGEAADGGEAVRLAGHVRADVVLMDIGRLLAKLDLRDRVQAVVLAYETGIVRPGAPPGGGPAG